MKLFLVIAMCVFTVNLFAQNKNEQKLIDAISELKTAMINADSIRLDKLTATKLNYGHSSGVVDDKKIFIQKLVSGKSDFVTIDLTEQTIDLVQNNIAIVRHKLYATTNDGGKPGEVHLKVLLVWILEKKQWKLLARQAIKVEANK